MNRSTANTTDLLWQQALAAHRAARLDDAASLYLEILRALPTHAGALNNLGIVHRGRGESAEAERLFRAALAALPDFAEAHLNLGHVRGDQSRPAEAVAAYRSAIALRPDHAVVHGDLGLQLLKLNDLERAGASFAQAAALQPDLHRIHAYRSHVFSRLRRFDPALACLDRAADLDPADARVARERGNLLERLGRFGEAIAAYGRADALDPGQPRTRAAWLGAKQRVCDWDGLSDLESAVLADVENDLGAGRRTTLSPLAHCRLIDDPALRLKIAQSYAREVAPGLSPLAPRDLAREAARPRLRIAYLSCGFGNHPVGHMIAGPLTAHDRTDFEVTAYGYGGLGAVHMRESLASICERFVDLTALGDRAAAQRIRDDGIDILVDLHAWADASRPAILALKPAPIQIAWLGYPGSFGAPFIDYTFVDRAAVPPGGEDGWLEKLVYLPHAYLPGDNSRMPHGPIGDRARQGLPEDAMVFASFNQPFKITRPVWAAWMTILKATPRSVLWLLEGNPEARRNLRQEARRHGIDAGRLVFARRLARDGHLQRLGLADLALDTFPYTGGVTTLDMLLAGVPVVTCAGRSLAARHSASLLIGAGLDDLVTGDIDAYGALALALANDPEARGRMRARVDVARRSAAQFDIARFTRTIERAYARMWARAAAGLPPQSFAL